MNIFHQAPSGALFYAYRKFIAAKQLTYPDEKY
jgi:hypothetical protein